MQWMWHDSCHISCDMTRSYVMSHGSSYVMTHSYASDLMYDMTWWKIYEGVMTHSYASAYEWVMTHDDPWLMTYDDPWQTWCMTWHDERYLKVWDWRCLLSTSPGVRVTLMSRSSRHTHVTLHMNESCHITYEWVMSHYIWMSHVTPHEWVMSHGIWRCGIGAIVCQHRLEFASHSCHTTHEWVMSHHIWMSHVTLHINDSFIHAWLRCGIGAIVCQHRLDHHLFIIGLENFRGSCQRKRGLFYRSLFTHVRLFSHLFENCAIVSVGLENFWDSC